MKKKNFPLIITICSAFFLIFLIYDEEFVPDRPLQQIIEGALLALLLGIIGITATKYYGDVTTDDTIRGLTKVLAELEKRIQNLESKIDKT
jgi:hypothetical protein